MPSSFAMKDVFSAYDQRTKSLASTSPSNPYAEGIAWTSQSLSSPFFTPIAEATIPLVDQGFLHSDLTYDVPAIWDGRFFRLQDHLDRLEASATKMRLHLPVSKDDMKNLMCEMARLSGIRDAYCMLILTRGPERVPKGPNTAIAVSKQQNRLYIFLTPYIWVMPPSDQMHGPRSAVITRTVRRIPPGAFDPTIKNLMWGDFTKGILEAGDRGSTYPFLTDGDANLTEGAGYNILLILNDTLHTPDRGVLEGVTRKSVFEAARRKGFPVRVEVVPVELAYQADEIFMCTTAGGVMPITELDGNPVGDGKIGKLTNVIWEENWAMHYEPEFSFAVEYGDRKASRANL